MTPGVDPMVQVVPLRAFQALATALLALPRSPGGDAECPAGRSPVAEGECVQCGMKVSGEALMALTAPPPDEGQDPRVERLRQGYCARKGCESYFYRLSFRPWPGVNWPSVIARIHDEAGGAERKDNAVPAVVPMVRRQFLSQAVLRGGIALGALAALWLARHWHRGGRIPYLREPERFEVDVLSAEEREALESWRAYRPR
ncbi:MAG: hypothetical protein KF833_01715 [Verrucomicrobiae bacterium]|nr:hypothetical protein [Verrucomicrobiae bacterium]